jgi:DNA-binding SARP family transcriptional activator
MVRRAERHIEFRILGPLQVMDGDTAVEVAGTKRRAVLARLVLHANEIVRSERLIDDLWGDQAPRNASAALHNHVCRLRKVLGSELLVRRECGYALRVDEDAIDLRRFERLVAAAEPLAASKRSAALAEALRLWRGPALAELGAEPGFRAEIARLDELRIVTLERRIDADLEAGRCGELVGEIEALIAEHPWREHLRWQLILALYRAGRQAEALEVYRETRRLLTEELGLEPSPALQELERAILRQDPAIAVGPQAAESAAGQPRKRRRVLFGLLVAGMLGVAAASAFAVATETGSHGTTQASLVAANGVGSAMGAPTNPGSVQASSSAAGSHASRRGQAETRSATFTSEGQTTTASSQAPAAAEPIAHTSSLRTTRASANARRAVPRPLRIRAKARSGAKRNAIATQPSHKPSTRTTSGKPVHIADDFSDPQLDPLIWGQWEQGTGASAAQQNDQLVLSIAADATFESQFHSAGVNVGTKCKFPGDFDTRVDFALPNWPAGNGASVSLVAYQAGPVDLISRTTTSQWGDIYNTFPAQGSVPLSDTTGSLRITRSNSTARTYFWHHGQWQKLGAQRIAGEIWVGLSLGTFAERWRRMSVTATFDNFVLTAPDAVCPPGSDPRDP